MLSDSKDLLEDPNNDINYFDIHEESKPIKKQPLSIEEANYSSNKEAYASIETPAFGKKGSHI